MGLLEVGFWQKDEHDDRPHPRELQDKQWFASHGQQAARVIEYLQWGGCVESYEMGYSFCRLGDCTGKEMGACTLTDGVYCWPEGLVHYVKCHNVRPPQAFLEHILAQPFTVLKPPKRLLMWDHESQSKVAMPMAMQTMILHNTTITIEEDSCCIN